MAKYKIEAYPDLFEMVLGKTDVSIAKRYDEMLVPEGRRKLGEGLRSDLVTTWEFVKRVTRHEKPHETNRVLRKLMENRLPYVNPINMLQVEILRWLRKDENQCPSLS